MLKTPRQMCDKDKNLVRRTVVLQSCTECSSMSRPPFEYLAFDTVQYTMAGLLAREISPPQHLSMHGRSYFTYLLTHSLHGAVSFLRS